MHINITDENINLARIMVNNLPCLRIGVKKAANSLLDKLTTDLTEIEPSNHCIFRVDFYTPSEDYVLTNPCDWELLEKTTSFDGFDKVLGYNNWLLLLKEDPVICEHLKEVTGINDDFLLACTLKRAVDLIHRMFFCIALQQ